MKTPRSFPAVTAAGLLLAAALAQGADRASCCFTNHRYTGVCAVEPGENETCGSILAYLNNPQSQGKSYCGNTNIRGGWKQVACERKDSAATRRVD